MVLVLNIICVTNLGFMDYEVHDVLGKVSMTMMFALDCNDQDNFLCTLHEIFMNNPSFILCCIFV